jgi:hypothetical protein
MCPTARALAARARLETARLPVALCRVNDWLKIKDPAAAVVQREAEED